MIDGRDLLQRYFKTSEHIVFTTRENLRLLAKCRIWFFNGTFDTAPTIFTQVFAILGTIYQTVNGEENEVGILLVYALINSKYEIVYIKILQVVRSEMDREHLSYAEFIMSDFEFAIINASMSVFAEYSKIKACFF